MRIERKRYKQFILWEKFIFKSVSNVIRMPHISLYIKMSIMLFRATYIFRRKTKKINFDIYFVLILQSCDRRTTGVACKSMNNEKMQKLTIKDEFIYFSISSLKCICFKPIQCAHKKIMFRWLKQGRGHLIQHSAMLTKKILSECLQCDQDGWWYFTLF